MIKSFKNIELKFQMKINEKYLQSIENFAPDCFLPFCGDRERIQNIVFSTDKWEKSLVIFSTYNQSAVESWT